MLLCNFINKFVKNEILLDYQVLKKVRVAGFLRRGRCKIQDAIILVQYLALNPSVLTVGLLTMI